MQPAILLTAAEYARLKEQEDKLSNWLGKRTSYHPDELPAGITSISNEARSLMEVYEFITYPPTRYFAYYYEEKQIITTWTGDQLGKIVSCGAPYHSNMGDERQPIRVQAINGKTYTGTAYLSAGDYCRLKQVKS